MIQIKIINKYKNKRYVIKLSWLRSLVNKLLNIIQKDFSFNQTTKKNYQVNKLLKILSSTFFKHGLRLVFKKFLDLKTWTCLNERSRLKFQEEGN